MSRQTTADWGPKARCLGTYLKRLREGPLAFPGHLHFSSNPGSSVNFSNVPPIPTLVCFFYRLFPETPSSSSYTTLPKAVVIKNLLPSHHHLYQGDQNMAFNAVPKLLQPPFPSSSAAPSPGICHSPHIFHKSSLTHPGKSNYPLLVSSHPLRYAIIAVLQSCVHFSSSSCGVTLSRGSASFICVLTVPKGVIQVEMYPKGNV